MSHTLPQDINQTALISTFARVRRRNPRANLWFSYSPKNDRLQWITGDLPFYLATLLEGDSTVQSFQLGTCDAECATETIELTYFDGRRSIWAIRRKNSKGAAQVARQISTGELDPRTVALKTDDDVRGREIEIDNWLLLCSAIARARFIDKSREIAALKNRMAVGLSSSLEELLSLEDCRASMLAVIAVALQRRVLHTNLTTALLGASSILSRGEAHD